MWCIGGTAWSDPSASSREECEKSTKAKGFSFYYWLTPEKVRCLPIGYDIQQTLERFAASRLNPGERCTPEKGYNLYSLPDGNKFV